MAKRLDSKILAKLCKETGFTEASIRTQLSTIRGKYPSITLNGAAHRFAAGHGFKVMGMLDDEDRASIPSTLAHAPAVSAARGAAKGGAIRPRSLTEILKYTTTDSFGKRHIEEANKAYTYGCYTASFILCRKIFENLVINDILIKKFPETVQANHELYYNTAQGRFRDFSEIVANLYAKRTEFPPTCKKPIERLYDKLKAFMADANDYTHSWYHLCTKSEFDKIGVQEIGDLIAKISVSI